MCRVWGSKIALHLKAVAMDGGCALDVAVGRMGGRDRERMASSSVGGYLPRVRLTLDTGKGLLDSVGASAIRPCCKSPASPSIGC